MVVKIICIVLGIILVLTAGYMVVNTIINLFNGYDLSESINTSWYNLTHLWGLIKDKTTADIIIPMANSKIAWEYAKYW